MRIIEAALAEGYIVVALSSQDRVHSRCWDTGWPPELSIDIQKVSRLAVVLFAPAWLIFAVDMNMHIYMYCYMYCSL